MWVDRFVVVLLLLGGHGAVLVLSQVKGVVGGEGQRLLVAVQRGEGLLPV